MGTGRHNSHVRGINHPKAKLTDDQIMQMRRMYRPRIVGYKDLAEHFSEVAGTPISWRTCREIVHLRNRVLTKG